MALKLKNPFKKEKPIPVTAERKRLMKLPTGTLIEISNAEKKSSDKDTAEVPFSYTSILDEFTSSSTAVIFANPAAKSDLQIGVSYDIIFKTNIGIYKDSIEVTDFFEKGDSPCINVKFTGNTVRQQRRKHVRIDDYIKFDFEIIEKKQSGHGQQQFNSIVDKFENFQKQQEFEAVKMRKYMQLFIERSQDKENPVVFPYSAETLDISAGGMRFTSNYKLEVDSILGLVLHIKNRDVYIIGKILHADDMNKFSGGSPTASTSATPSKPSISTLSMFNSNQNAEENVEVTNEYTEVASNFQYMYKCTFESVSQDTKEYMQQYIIDKTLL